MGLAADVTLRDFDDISLLSNRNCATAVMYFLEPYNLRNSRLKSRRSDNEAD